MNSSTTNQPIASPRTGSLLIVFLTVFIDLLGFGIVLPVLPVYGRHFAEEHAWSDAQVGWMVGLLMSSFSLMQFLFLPVWGKLSDRYGRRPILLVGLVGSTLFYALFAWSSLARSLTGLFVSRIGAGIAGATISTAQAYIADTTAERERAKGMALIGAAFALGFTLGPLVGAGSLLLSSPGEFSPWPGYVASGLSGLALLLAIFKLPESLSTPATGNRHLLDFQAIQLAMRSQTLPLLLLTSFVTITSFSNFESTLSLQVETLITDSEEREEESPQDGELKVTVEWLQQLAARLGMPERSRDLAIMLTFAFLGGTLTLAQGVLVRRLAGRLSEYKLALAGTIVSTGAFALLVFAIQNSRLDWMLITMAVEVVGFALVTPSIQSLISKETSPEDQGQILGFSQSLASLARIIGPIVGIRLFTQSRYLPYAVATVIMLVGVVLVMIAARTRSIDDQHLA